MEPLENGQIQPLGLSHAIGPPGWRPYFQRGIPSILKRLKPTLNPTTKAFGGHFLWHPLPPPCPPLAHRQIPGTQAPPALPGPRLAPPLGPLAPPGPPWPPLAALATLAPARRPLAAPGPLLSLPFSAEETSACLAAKAEVGIEGASPKP